MSYNFHAGHCPQDKGAFGAVGILKESVENRLVNDECIRLLREQGETVYDCTCNENVDQGTCLKKIVEKCNAHDVELDVSIHLNSGRNDYVGDGSTGGVEVWLYDNTDKEVVAIAENICKNISETLKLRNRGVKYSKSFYVLKNTKAKAMIVECCFVDDADDAKVWNAKKCAKAIVEGVLGKKVDSTPSQPTQKPTTSTYTGNSIVDYLNSVGIDSTFANRKKLAEQYGISNYTGTASQNLDLLNKMRGGVSAPTQTVSYYKAFVSSSIVDGLKSIGVDSSFSNRKKIAQANGISNYTGTASQNEKLLSLARQGKLKK